MTAAAGLAEALSLLVAGVLLWAGIEKARDTGPAASTLRALGAPPGVAPAAAWSVALAEVGVAACLLFAPGSAAAVGGVVSLACAFALAGLVALLRGQKIRCGCFGRGGNRYLGRRQIVALPAWLVAAALLGAGADREGSWSAGAARLATAALAIAAVRAAAVWKARAEACGDRLSAREMFAWPS